MSFQCSGPSMEPTIQNADIVFAENLSRHFYGIQRYICHRYIKFVVEIHIDIVSFLQFFNFIFKNSLVNTKE